MRSGDKIESELSILLDGTELYTVVGKVSGGSNSDRNPALHPFLRLNTKTSAA